MINRHPIKFLVSFILIVVLFSSIACALSDFLPQATPTPAKPTTPTTAIPVPSSTPIMAPSPTIKIIAATPTESSTATPSPQPTQGSAPLTSYTNPSYGFGFNYPGDWILQEEPHFIRLSRGSLTLSIGFQRAYESLYIGPTGIGVGELQNRGSVYFAEQVIPRLNLVFEGKDKAVYYNDPSGIQIGSLMFFISLSDSNPDYQAIQISPQVQVEVDNIAASFQLSAMLYQPTGSAAGLLTYFNPLYGLEFSYPGSWALQQGANYAKLEAGTLSLSISFRRLVEQVELSPGSIGPGDFQVKGGFTFLGKRVLRAARVLNGKVKSVYYNGPNEIRVAGKDPAAGLAFLISLSDLVASYDTSDIPAEVQAEVNRILESFKVSFGVPDSCTDIATVNQDIIVTGGKSLSPGQVFTKTWQLRNAGSCTWTTQYDLVYIAGDLVESIPVARPASIAPGAAADFSLEITAPTTTGEHQGSWLLRNADGRLFGSGANAETPLSVEVSVGEAGVEAGLGEPTWRDTLDTARNWYLPSTDNVQFITGGGYLVMTALNAGTADEWNASYLAGIHNFYLEGIFKTGTQCSGLDRYGFLFRAPTPNSGYIFGFSCDGRYRLYKWDGANYTGLLEWTRNANILSGPNQANRLGVLAQADTFKLYANGKLLNTIIDSSYYEGQFGLFIGAPNTANFQVYVDEVSYWVK